jgi:hypothetical protein
MLNPRMPEMIWDLARVPEKEVQKHQDCEPTVSFALPKQSNHYLRRESL